MSEAGDTNTRARDPATTSQPLAQGSANGGRSVTVVVPVFNEGANLPLLLDGLDRTLTTAGLDWDAVFVDDGSWDESWSLLSRAATDDRHIRAVRLSRNFGHQVALTAGLGLAGGDLVVTMDGDLQHPPEEIPRLVAKANEGYDVVYAVRAPEDTEGWFKVMTAALFYRVLNRLTGLNVPVGAADFRLMSRRVTNIVVAMPERARFLRGLTRWVGFRQGEISYKRGRRVGGRSAYSTLRMLKFAFDAIVSFSNVPLRIMSVLGGIVAGLGFADLIYVVASRIFSHATVPGWASVIVAVLLLGGIQLLCFGIFGEYIARMYTEVKNRPLFIIAEDSWDDGADASGSGGRSAPTEVRGANGGRTRELGGAGE
jgi:glycosyltransferase involved in cell wall biosynthesis